ncbi:MAG: UDP-N-acetylmuramoylalanyl-D-glutamyl-2,6-diaminopimelate--D-alanyl-D-alanine ligase [Alphaproteobacteria bacterium]|nr:UDP-N-acetylmuramoylalanyl-D-glutamyl-2,6-diaminopimelate--D-alanyl-D-alanine ligase [Alphaproteobacteria bacterium]
MTALWTHQDAAAATGGQCRTAWVADGVSIDSRSLQPGDLFVAIQGDNSDGHAYVPDALAKGAAAAMVARDRPLDPKAGPLLVVDDTDNGLRDLGRAARDRVSARLVGVTGSVGKTGTKEMLSRALAAQGPTAWTQGNLNNHWGLPLSLARMPQDTAFGVFELGMNHAGEIGPLSKLLRPDVAVITTVEAVHLEFFPSEEAIADAKAEIFHGMNDHGAAVLNIDNRHYARLRAHAEAAGLQRICTFGADPSADIHLTDMNIDDDQAQVTATIGGEALHYSIGAPGRHWVLNSLAVLGAVRMIGADYHSAAAQLAEYRPMTGRGERQTVTLPDGSFLLIDESYNASPASMRAAIDVLGAAGGDNGGRRIAVLGDMLEIGSTAPEAHASLAESLTQNRIHIAIMAGENMAHLAAALPKSVQAHHGADSEAIQQIVLDTVQAGDVVMVKGSLGSRMIPIADALRARDSRARQPGATDPGEA